MNSSLKLESLQHRIEHHSEQANCYSFFNLLTSPELFSITEGLLPEHRERKYPPTETLSMFLSQAMSADRSCQNIVNMMAVQRSIDGYLHQNTHTGSYCKARKRLPVEFVSGLARQTSKLIDRQLPEAWRWQGRSVKLIDGTTVTMPDTPGNQQQYPQADSQDIGVGFPICRLVGIICLSSGCIMNAAMGPYQGKGADETALLRRMLDTFEKGDVVVGDAYYGGYFLLSEMIKRGVDIVFDQFGARRKKYRFSQRKKTRFKRSPYHLQKTTKKT